MKKQFIILILIFGTSIVSQAQKTVRIGYIDMEYILQNVPDYTDAKNQLEDKAQKWKQEIEVKKNEITKLQEALNSEKVLLTKELIEEREQEIKFQQTELEENIQKRFGPNGDVVVQKTMLVKPIQDQVFTAVQDIAEAKRYDFIFDKSSDLTMIFSAKRFDISDQVVRVITRSTKREQMTKKQLKDQDAKEKALEAIEENPALTERQKILEERKLAREKLISDKNLAAEERKKEYDAQRQKIIDDRVAKKNGTIPANDKKAESNNDKNTTSTISNDKQKLAIDKQTEREQAYEERKKALEDKKAKILADREAVKKLREEEKLKKN